MDANTNVSSQKADTAAANPESELTAKAASAAHEAVDIAAQNLQRAERALRDAQTSAGIKVDEATEAAQLYSKETLDTVREYVHENPLRSVGIALAAGYLLSSILRK